MGKSLRTSLMSYTSLYLRRSRTGRGFEPPTERVLEGCRAGSNRVQQQFPSRPGRNQRAVPYPPGSSQTLSDITPLRCPEATAVVRRSTSHTTTRTAASRLLNVLLANIHHHNPPHHVALGSLKRI